MPDPHATVWVDFHVVTVGDHDAQDEPPQEAAEPLCLVFEPPVSTTSISTGVAVGDLAVRCEALDECPREAPAEWEDVAEVSLTVRHGPLMATGWNPRRPGDRLDGHGPGNCRVRVHARGRDTAYDDVATTPTEEYLVQAWPQEPSPPARLRATSALAQREADF